MADTDAQGGALNDENYDEVTGEIMPPAGLGFEDDPPEGDSEEDDEDGEDGDESGPDADAYAAGNTGDPLSLETLSGDIRDAMLSRFRMAPKPWAQMSEAQQRELVEGFGLAARDLVRKAVRMVTGFEFPRVTVVLGDVKIIGGDKARIEAKVTCGNIAENREVLGDYVGDHVLMLMVDSERFMSQRKEPQVEPDQPDLPLGDTAKDVTPADDDPESEAV